MIGASESKAAMFFRASCRAPSRSPACACSAPQQTCSAGVVTLSLFARSTRSVARLTLANNPSPAQPANNNTFSPPRLDLVEDFLPPRIIGRELSSKASTNSARGDIKRARRRFNSHRANPRSRNNLEAAKNIRNRHRDNHMCRNISRRILLAASDFGCASDSTSRLASSSCPYSTPAGQTCSHARHPKHRSICFANALDVSSSRPSATALIKYNRPRGPSFSFPVMTYVGHASRHKPQ